MDAGGARTPRGSRLERMIARLTAQRACLETAVAAVADLPGPMLEVGLGKGRTYDHLRCLAPERDIYVFEKLLHAPADCTPDAEHLFLGDFRETWALAAARMGAGAVLAHADIGSHDLEADAQLAAEISPLVDRLLRPGAVVLADRAMGVVRWSPQALPAAAGGWPYHYYRVEKREPETGSVAYL